MATYDEGGVSMTMPVMPAYNNGGGYGGGMGGFGDGWWFILVLLCCGNGMWGGMGGGMWPMMMNGMWGGMGGLYPWLDNSQHISDGFRDQQLQTSVTSIGDRMTSGFGDVQLGIAGLGRQICEAGGNITGAVRDAAAQAEISANNRQMANMQQQFSTQTQMAQGFCANREATADLKYTVGTESAANRFAGQNNTRDIIENQNRMGQAILDKLCQLELDGVKNQVLAEQRENANLRTQLSAAQFAASQAEQTAQLRTAAATIANQAMAEARACPLPSQPVYGNTPIFQCAGPQWNNSGCGCNNNSFAA